MIPDALKFPGMTPKELALCWKCRYCKHRWLIVDEDKPPKQCPNRECRRADWDRAKIKKGRPRQDELKGKPGWPRLNEKPKSKPKPKRRK